MGSHPTPRDWGEGRVLKLIISRRAMCSAKSISNLENSQLTIAAKVTDNASSSKEAVALVALPSRNGKALWQERRSTRLLMAAISPDTFTITSANDAFCHLVGRSVVESQLLDLFNEKDQSLFQQLYRRHIWHQVRKQQVQQKGQDLEMTQDEEDSVVVSLSSPLYPEPRFLQLWFNGDDLKITPINPESELRLENYRVEGKLLLEGIDVTASEKIRQLIDQLIDRDALVNPQKFQQINQQLRSLFRARNMLIIRAESSQAQLSFGTDYHSLNRSIYNLECLQASHFFRAAKAARVSNIPDLSQDCQTDCERSLLDLGVRSLLLIPLDILAVDRGTQSHQLLGLVGLTSDRPHNFTTFDCHRAAELIPALTCALRQASGQQFTHIHPAVAWRFLQEAERRSWGLPPEPIVFTNVYPLYGISDIRGSSKERNRAIQADLIAQFRLGLAVVEAVCQCQESSLAEQLKLDLLNYIKSLEEKVTVDAEVTAIEYLRGHLELYFDHFRACSDAARSAVDRYLESCDNDNKCIYQARRQYDRMIKAIDTQLQQTWESWQERMQKIIPHYCDIELTDGMDHMIYTGESINSAFSKFHFHSLRYEQLRAICDCARTAFRIQGQYETQLQLTHLVLVQNVTVDIFHDEKTEKLFDVQGTRDIRYEIIKKRIDKAVDANTRDRITQPGMLTIVYSTDEEWEEYQQYMHYLEREKWIAPGIESGPVEPLQGVEGLKFARVRVLPES